MKNRKLLTILLIVLNLFLMNLTVFAFSGWHKIDGKSCYLDEEGRMTLNAFRESDGVKYYLGPDGFLLPNRVFEYNGFIYSTDERGARNENKFVTVNYENDPYGEFAEGIYYFDETGRSIVKKDNKFYKNIDGKNYAFSEEGYLIEGWLDEDGNPITNPESILTDGVYYAQPGGVLLSSAWYNFNDDIGVIYTDGQNVTFNAEKYEYLDDFYMYFDQRGKKVKADINTDKKEKKKVISGKEYAFDEFGIMLNTFTVNGDLDYSQKQNPTLQEDVKYYSLSGELVKNQWIKTIPSQLLSQADYDDLQENWYRTDENGKIIHNKIKKIDGKKYLFDGQGQMRTGFALSNNELFISSFKPEELKRRDFIETILAGSTLHGVELGELRFFGLNEDTDGYMVTGDIQIELEDGICDFLFDSKGIAYGSHSTVKRKNNYYYLNGLRMKPWDEQKYGILRDAQGEYVLLNQKGIQVKGKRKIIRDELDNYIIINNSKVVAYIELPTNVDQLKWKSKNGSDILEDGYYFFNKDTKEYTLAVSGSKYSMTRDEADSIPKDIHINF